MSWAIAANGQTDFQQHSRQGGIRLNLADAALSSGSVAANRAYDINVHAALMTVAWVLLLPLGAMFPRHR